MPKATTEDIIRRGPVHLVGIKGTGMSALAELLSAAGVPVTGSDTDETFYTDEILQALKIPCYEGFSEDNIPPNTALVVRSAAYTRDNNPECAAAEARGVPLLVYPEAVAAFSRGARFAGVAGIHGKTTTTAMAGTILAETGLPASVLVGSAVPSFGGRSTLSRGGDYFIAETCEYRRHFLSFQPRFLVVTNIEADHLDYYRDADDVMDAFTEYAGLLPGGGELIYCADDPGAARLAAGLKESRPDLALIPYGFSAAGPYAVTSLRENPGVHTFTLGDLGQFELFVPGRHMVQNAAAALALADRLVIDHCGNRPEGTKDGFRRGLAGFTGCRRRSEVLGEAGGILFIDDYGHHPTEIVATLAGYRDFYPRRRIVVDFMSHTYSRTEKLLDGFAEAFGAADVVILHKIYSSARERKGRVDGRRLFEEVSKHHGRVVYFHEVLEAEDYCIQHLQPGDVFITLGAGNNWVLGHRLLKYFGKGDHG